MSLIAGVDEAGRGPLAGPVVAAAVILPDGVTIKGVRDSKRLSEKRREALFDVIYQKATSIGVGIVHEDEIDKINILRATQKAMRTALGRLNPQPCEALIDGGKLPDQIVKNRGIPHGDEKIHVISAASIIAKVSRDRIMRDYDKVFPEYQFAKHKGYGTKYHLKTLKQHLACPIHRKTFRPVRDCMPTLSYFKKKRLLGKLGEQLAARELVHKGYEIIEMNYKAVPYGEIDIVARNRDATVFVEVKTATQNIFGDPEMRVDEMKLERIENVVEVYLDDGEEDSDYQFDIMTVFLGKGKPIIRHLRDCLN